MCSSRSTGRIPDTIQVFENFHKWYDKWFTRHQWVYRSEIEAVSRLIPQGGLGLEVGVGTGRFATPFAVAVGLDPSRFGSDANAHRALGIFHSIVRSAWAQLSHQGEPCFCSNSRNDLSSHRIVDITDVSTCSAD